MSAGRVLILFVHPALQKSRANVPLLEAVQGLDRVTVHDLYEAYPDFHVDVEREQQLLLSHDAVVFQHPFYWYSSPALLKQWQDLVLEFGWAFGPGGDHLAGKPALHAITTGGGVDAYGRGGRNRFSIPELLRPFEQTARLCGMRWLPPFTVHGSGRLSAEAILEVYAPAYRALVVGLRDRTLALPDDGELEAINELIGVDRGV